MIKQSSEEIGDRNIANQFCNGQYERKGETRTKLTQYL